MVAETAKMTYYKFKCARIAGGLQWKILKPTGLCKLIKSDACFAGVTNYVQHQGRFFKRWIPERDICKFDEEIYKASTYITKGK
jgi:hypothetical protein